MMGKAALNLYISHRLNSETGLKLPPPTYIVVKTEGLDHIPIFTIVCSAESDDGEKWTAIDEGYSKKAAQNKSATTLYNYLLLLQAPNYQAHLACPKCSKEFKDGFYHPANLKLHMHMSHGDEHRKIRKSMSEVFKDRDRLIHEIRNR